MYDRATIVDTTLDFIGGVLRLPESVRIERVEMDLQRPGTLRMLLVGDGLPKKFAVNVNGLIGVSRPVIHTDDSGCATWDWGD